MFGYITITNMQRFWLEKMGVMTQSVRCVSVKTPNLSHLFTQRNDCPCLDHGNLLLISEILDKTQQVWGKSSLLRIPFQLCSGWCGCDPLPHCLPVYPASSSAQEWWHPVKVRHGCEDVMLWHEWCCLCVNGWGWVSTLTPSWWQ